MAEVLVAPDVPALVCSWLGDQLDLPTDTTVPNPRPDTFILARRVGGQRRDLVVEDVTVNVECWAATKADADDLGQLANAHVHAMARELVDGQRIYRVRDIAAPADLPDELSSQPRHVFTVQITVRCTTPISST